ncbi:hypothetical protein PoB_004739800 [Plakobranchus ocellatus]|uniref:Uncharacterized protein n=1 Tax=Plakobranchus ocellatus TaxID=259542 RepID=A0AAV4BQ41_9GAST|nr:hypothetical protein PoB_004739800 [Plakobranchus ocellatus]
MCEADDGNDGGKSSCGDKGDLCPDLNLHPDDQPASEPLLPSTPLAAPKSRRIQSQTTEELVDVCSGVDTQRPHAQPQQKENVNKEKRLNLPVDLHLFPHDGSYEEGQKNIKRLHGYRQAHGQNKKDNS